jgi:hypothetical protein
VEAFSNEFFSADSFARREEQYERYRAAAVKLGRSDIPEIRNLLYEEVRTEVIDWLRAHGWDVSGVTADDLMAGNDRTPPPGLDDDIPQSVFVTGIRK